MEVQHLLIPLGGRLHFLIWLISHNMVDLFKLRSLNKFIEGLLVGRLLESWKEHPSVVHVLNECMDRRSVCLNSSHYHRAMFVFHLLWFSNRFCSSGDGSLVNVPAILHSESDVVNTVSTLIDDSGEFLVAWVEGRSEGEGSASISDDMGDPLSGSSLQALIAHIIEAKSAAVEAGSLLSISHVESRMVKSKELSNLRLLSISLTLCAGFPSIESN